METIEDIISELRNQGKYNKENVDLDWKAEEVGDLQIRIADRIEEVWQIKLVAEKAKAAAEGYVQGMRSVTDCNHLGDAAKMRESAKATMKFLESAIVDGKVSVEDISTLQNIVSKALSAPTRNCDLYETESERQTAFINWYNETFDLKDEYAIDTCDLKHNVEGILHEYIEWLFANAKGESENA